MLPERAQIGIVKALALLRGIGKVEHRARLDVVDMPFTAILPGHAIPELRFKMCCEFIRRAADQFNHAPSLRAFASD